MLDTAAIIWRRQQLEGGRTAPVTIIIISSDPSFLAGSVPSVHPCSGQMKYGSCALLRRTKRKTRSRSVLCIMLIFVVIVVMYLSFTLRSTSGEWTRQAKIGSVFRSWTRACQYGQWTNLVRQDNMEIEHKYGQWSPSETCAFKEFDAQSAATCFAKHRRILMVGDSVHRGLFWNIVGLLTNAEGDGRGLQQHIRIRVDDNMKDSRGGSYTNVQDQTLTATDARDGTEIFTVRFVYAAHASDFLDRCEAVHKWFFQCPEPLDSVLMRVLGEDESDDGQRPYDVVYVNVGMWDWRTGVPVSMFAENVARALDRVSARLGRSTRRLIWRHTTAAYPSKFAWPDECKNSKIRQDDRPCNIHTDGLFHYNVATSRVVSDSGFDILDSWPVTSTRPDMTTDGIHYSVGSRQRAKDHGYEWASDMLVTPMYRVLNDMLLTLLCP